MINDRKFNIKTINMSQEMRQFVLDEVRRVIEQNLDDVQSSTWLKTKLEQKYNGIWNIVIGNGMQTYFNELYFRDYIELETELKSIMIFRKCRESYHQDKPKK